MVNRCLERSGQDERIDRRSHAERGLDEQPTIHEGVTARALERKGIVSDRCELNREIRADNALLRELKSLVKKLMGAVKNTIPAIADAMETVRQKMIIFRYQLLHIKSGKTRLTDTLKVVRPDIKRYEDVVKRLKAKIRERRTLLEEKKAVPAIQVFRHREFAQRIATLTKDIEDLKSEKTLLLNQLDCANDHGMVEVKRRIASMKSTLEKLEQQETKYTAELDEALAQYSELQQQATDLGSMKLDTALQATRPDKECETLRQLRATYGKRFDSKMLMRSRKDIADLLDETSEPVAIHQRLQQPYAQQDKRHHTKKHSQER